MNSKPALNRLTSYTPPVPANHSAITYTYNNLGQKTSMTNGSQTVHYQYYANGWLKAVTDGTNPYAVYSYDTAGNRTGVTLGNDATTAYAYDSDPRYRVSSITHTPTVGNPVTISYPSRDSAGNPLTMTIGNTTTTYTYDANSRLTNDTEFAYDWVGNRNPGSCTYNGADEITAAPGHQYTYLGTGSLYEQKDSQGTVQKTYAYTPANLLSSVVHAGIGTSSMAWDASAKRVSFSSSTGGTWSFVYDINAGVPAVVEELTPGASIYYVREPEGELIARVAGADTRYYHFDGIGSTRLLTDGDGSVTDTYSYDAWGNLVAHYGGTEQPYEFVGELGYYSHYQDENLFSESGWQLLQLGVRAYCPGTGRFFQRDPKALDTVADMCYSDDNPNSGVDPDGMKCRPYHDGGRLRRCWPMLRRGAGRYPFYDRARRRVGLNVYMCDGDGRDFGIIGAPANGSTRCWKVKRDGKPDWECRIDFYEDSVFSGNNDICCTLLHELMHAGNWPASNKRADVDPNSSFSNAYNAVYDYRCNPDSPCYGKPWTPSPGQSRWLK